MGLWKRKKDKKKKAETGDKKPAAKQKSPPRKPPVAMEVKLLAMDAVGAGLSPQEVGDLVGRRLQRPGELEKPPAQPRLDAGEAKGGQGRMAQTREEARHQRHVEP